MNNAAIARKLAVSYHLPKADKYDLFLREYDNMVEVLGFVQDPTLDMKDYVNREMLFPKRWVTLCVLPKDEVDFS